MPYFKIGLLMPDLSDKLKSLGVKVGARNLPPPTQQDAWSISRVMPGRVYATSTGETYLVEASYPSPLKPRTLTDDLTIDSPGISASLDIIAAWAGDARIQASPLSAFAFLDIETTGLSGGTGTYAFLVGIARYEGDHFQLAQFFLRDPSEEPAHLLAVEEFLAPCEVLVTFNGKAFDAPLLATRFLTHGWRFPIADVAHLDLLHLARRLWRDRLPNRALGSLEVEILGLPRTNNDIPGWMIPEMYFDYLHTGDARPLENVFYHNAVDVISMVSLLDHIAHLLDDPIHAQIEHALDLFAVTRLYDELGRWEEAIPLYRLAIERLAEDAPRQDAIRRLSLLHKRRGEWESALALWQQAAEAQQLYACEELAKYNEHYVRQPHEALHWTLTALEWLNAPACPHSERIIWQPEFQHRLERLKRKTTG
jgi:uncharacterized protein YprB with RNaseH-like and TPR domain